MDIFVEKQTFLEATTGKIRFCNNVFDLAKHFGQKYAMVRSLEVKGASSDGLLC